MRRQVVIKHLHKQEALRVETPDVESLSDTEILKRYQDKNVQRRLIVASWPRDPKGKYLPKTTGKYATEEKYPWGGTILDFFVVRSYPAVPHVIAFSTSSRLLEAMTLLGEEFEHATHCLNYAKAEKDPRLLLLYDTAKLILEDEKNIKNARAGKTLTQDSQWWIDDEVRSSFTLLLSFQPGYLSHAQNFRTSIFNPSRCPVPWPIEPFSYQPAKLEKRLPFGLLPETLYVHASSRLLSASSTEDDSDDKPLVFKYRLKLTTEGKKKAEELKKETSENRDCYEYFPKAFFTGSIPPPVRALLPPRPPIERPKEAHLYMSADYRAGCGNHSYVYHAEWELPRDLLVPDVLCKKCIDDGVNQRIMKEDRGEDESQKNNKWKDMGGYLVARKHLLKGSRGYIVDYIANTNFGSIHPREDHADNVRKENQYNGIYRPVESGAEYQNSSRKPYCPHIQKLDFGDFATHPLTARVRVAAKLSMEDDDHLEREASNYQRFPDYFFEQYSGYHLVPDLRQVIPVGAIVPQFYGYYVPDESCAQNHDEYLSPILLLEDCGSQIGDIALSIDDR